MVALILIIIAGKGYFGDKDNWGWWLLAGAIVFVVGLLSSDVCGDDEDEEDEEEEAGDYVYEEDELVEAISAAYLAGQTGAKIGDVLKKFIKE